MTVCVLLLMQQNAQEDEKEGRSVWAQGFRPWYLGSSAWGLGVRQKTMAGIVWMIEADPGFSEVVRKRERKLGFQYPF